MADLLTTSALYSHVVPQWWAHAHLVKQLQKGEQPFISQNTHMNVRGLSNTGSVPISIDK